MNAAKTINFWMIISLILLAGSNAYATVVTYTLDNVILDESDAQMFGTFSWTFDIGDFENGVGQFSFLEIPFTSHDQTDLNAVFDIGNSIEITLEGSVHDDGVDITLFLLQPLTPTTGSAIDLAQSRYEIGGNGFHVGGFLSGNIVPSDVTGVWDPTTSPETAVAVPTITLTAYPNPFNPMTTIIFDLPVQMTVSLCVYDVSGLLVRTLCRDEARDQGRNSAVWNGRDESGLVAAAGVYFYKLDADDFSETRRMTLLK